MSKEENPERTRRRAEWLNQVAANNRKSAAEMDQMAARLTRKLRPEGEPIPCCLPGPCMVCGVDSPSGHVHVGLPDSHQTRAIAVGRVCSSHTLREVIRTDRFLISIEGEADEPATDRVHA